MNQTNATKPPVKNGGSAPPSRRRFTPGQMAALIAGGVLIVFIAVTAITLFAYGNIYPNVSVAGVDVGGLSVAAAEEKIDDALREYAEGSLSVTCRDETFALSVREAGADVSAAEAADAAHALYRAGGLFERIANVFSSPFVAREATLDGRVDEVAVGRFVSQVKTGVDREKNSFDFEIEGDTLTVWPGESGLALNAEQARELVTSRFLVADISPLSLDECIEEDPVEEIDVNALYSEVYVEPENAKLDTSGDEPTVIPHVTGISFDKADASSRLRGATGKVEIPLVLTEPELSEEMLRATLFQDLLATYTTKLNAANLPRTKNVRLAANSISGTILNPGDIFSFNGIVGQRTRDRGYGDASVYTATGIEDDLGGGICQVSSTVHLAALRADMKIVSRANHSYTVVYAPLGEDATVYWGSLDYKFENSQTYPIKIVAFQQSDYITVQIWGTKTNDNTVEIKTTVLSHTPYKTIEEPNPNMAPGTRKQKVEGHSQYSVDTYRIVRDGNGTELRNEYLGRSNYRRLDRVIEVGVTAPV
ncbi:VanW family protein, partial [Oscillospiraceae bacterium OttesenSCG-928-G22]|nr:VanW family protein [Oscillospiraceae bacterium OttesenSCG-928-G22]